MFDKDFFQDDPDTGPGRIGQEVGRIGAWGLHLAKVAFLVYSGYHGVSASLNYAGNNDLARVAQMVGIVVLEVTLFSLYLAWHNQRITGTAQSIAAGITYAIGFILACLGIVADSQLHAAVAMSPWLVSYLRWGLPIAPAAMALGALLTHELEPGQLRKRGRAVELVNFAEEQFKAFMAGERAEMNAAKTIRNMQLNARRSAAEQVAQWYSSEQAQQAITSTALQNAPALLRAIGVNIQDVPDGNKDGRIDPAELEAYLAAHPEIAARALGKIQPPEAAAPAGDEFDKAMQLLERSLALNGRLSTRTGMTADHPTLIELAYKAVLNRIVRGGGALNLVDPVDIAMEFSISQETARDIVEKAKAAAGIPANGNGHTEDFLSGRNGNGAT